MIDRIFRLLREPIVLFFVLGGLIFLLYSGTSSYYKEREKQIVVSSSQIKFRMLDFALLAIIYAYNCQSPQRW